MSEPLSREELVRRYHTVVTRAEASTDPAAQAALLWRAVNYADDLLFGNGQPLNQPADGADDG